MIGCLPEAGSLSAAPACTGALRGLGCVWLRLPTDEGVSDWLSRPRWGAFRIAAELAVACGWEGARDVPTEQTRFRVAWSRAHAHFESDSNEPDSE